MHANGTLFHGVPNCLLFVWLIDGISYLVQFLSSILQSGTEGFAMVEGFLIGDIEPEFLLQEGILGICKTCRS